MSKTCDTCIYDGHNIQCANCGTNKYHWQSAEPVSDPVTQFRAHLNNAISEGWSGAEIARKAGLKANTVCNYANKVMPSLDKADKILKAIGKTITLGG